MCPSPRTARDGVAGSASLSRWQACSPGIAWRYSFFSQLGRLSPHCDRASNVIPPIRHAGEEFPKSSRQGGQNLGIPVAEAGHFALGRHRFVVSPVDSRGRGAAMTNPVGAGEVRMLIDGELVEATSGKRFENINPATEEVLGEVADASAEDMQRAIDSSRRAFDEA